ncbi:MAG: HAMP domain-containing histidine kinase [Magnetococcales bacterium]|nr:HAMP domain-containing histidine kinase [Magnetococcales bacterium]
MNPLHALLIESARESDPRMMQLLVVILEQQAKLSDNNLYHGLLVDLIAQIIESEQQLMHHKEALQSAKEELEAQNRQLIELDQIKQDVELIARHDLKSPLNGILGCAELLLDTDLSSAQKSHLQTIRKAGMSALHMITLSLGLYRMEQKIYPLEPVRLDLVPILESIREDLRILINGNELHLRVSLEYSALKTGDAFFVRGEELLCYSMLANLIKNALEAAPPGSTVRVMLFERDFGGVILIHNLGAVPEGLRANFFEKYTTSGKRSGTGLGTYSAKLICETMGGRIGMHASEAEGTRIVVVLPSGRGDTAGDAIRSEVIDPWKSCPLEGGASQSEAQTPGQGGDPLRAGPVDLLRAVRRALDDQDVTRALERTEALKRLASEAGIRSVVTQALRLAGVIEVESWEEVEAAYVKLVKAVEQGLGS